MFKRWLKRLCEGEPNAVLAASLVALLVLLSIPPINGAGFVYTSIKFEILEDELRGTPPFRTEREAKFGDDIGIAAKRALISFPDPRSCLEDGIEALTPEILTRMDWGKMGRTAHVNVCVFRLLAASGDISYATAWFEAQGFRVPNGFSSANPYVDLDGSLRVSGRWSIRDDGPRFNKGSLMNVLVPDLAYNMNIHAVWSADGKELQHVTVGYSYK